MESKIQCGGYFKCPDCDYIRTHGPASNKEAKADFRAHLREHLADLLERTW
jgi:hypothetical protein